MLRNIKVGDDLSGKTLKFDFPDGYGEELLINSFPGTMIKVNDRKYIRSELYQFHDGFSVSIEYEGKGDPYKLVYEFYDGQETYNEKQFTLDNDYGIVTEVDTSITGYNHIFIEDDSLEKSYGITDAKNKKKVYTKEETDDLLNRLEKMLNKKANIFNPIIKDGLEIYHEEYPYSPYINFHYKDIAGDYTSRIVETSEGNLNVEANLDIQGNQALHRGLVSVIEGEINVSDSISGTTEINYPDGFNYDNTIVIGKMIDGIGGSNMKDGYVLINRVLPLVTLLNTGIRINITLSEATTGTYNYRIALYRFK